MFADTFRSILLSAPLVLLLCGQHGYRQRTALYRPHCQPEVCGVHVQPRNVVAATAPKPERCRRNRTQTGTLSPQPHPNRNVVTVTEPKPERCHRNRTQTGTLSPEPRPNRNVVTGMVGHTKDLVPFTDFGRCQEVVNLPITRYPFGHP